MFAADGTEEDKKVQLLTVFSGEEFSRLVQYPVVVELWEKKKSGRGQRLWLATFDQAQRVNITKYHRLFVKWHLQTGIPKSISCRMSTIELLQRAVDFFATL